MTYEDEKIAKLKKEKQQKKYTDIKTGVYIDNQFISFCPVKIFENVRIYIPKNFIEMPKEIQVVKYPSINRPQFIFTSLDTKINFAFNIIEKHLSEDQIIPFLVQAKEVIKKTNPAVVFYWNKQEKLFQGQRIYMFDLKSYGIDETLYNIVTFTLIPEGVLQGIFNCPEQNAESWRDVAWQAFQTIDA